MAAWEEVNLEEQPSHMKDFAQIWGAAEKIVYSKTLESVSTDKTRIERDFDPQAIRQLKSSSQRRPDNRGPRLASHALKAGLIDERRRFVAPVISSGR